MSLRFSFSCFSYLEYASISTSTSAGIFSTLQCSSSSHVEKLVVSSTSHEMTALANKSNSLSLTVLPHSCYITPVHLTSHFHPPKCHRRRNSLPQFAEIFLAIFQTNI